MKLFTPVFRAVQALLLLLMAAACAPSVNVSSDFDKAANFQQFRTYGWYHAAGNPQNDPERYDTFLDKRIRQAIEAGMASKGFTFTESNPDVKVAYDMRIETETRVD